jgi:ribosomal protein S1
LVSAVVKNVDLKNRKIRLSIKELESPSPHEAPPAVSYLNNRENVGSSLGLALADIKIELKS